MFPDFTEEQRRARARREEALGPDPEASDDSSEAPDCDANSDAAAEGLKALIINKVPINAIRAGDDDIFTVDLEKMFGKAILLLVQDRVKLKGPATKAIAKLEELVSDNEALDRDQGRSVAACGKLIRAYTDLSDAIVDAHMQHQTNAVNMVTALNKQLLDRKKLAEDVRLRELAISAEGGSGKPMSTAQLEALMSRLGNGQGA